MYQIEDNNKVVDFLNKFDDDELSEEEFDSK